MLPATYSIEDILKSTDYALDIFTPDEIAALEIYDRRGKPYVRDFCNNVERPAKPEEIVRQLYLFRLMHTYGYPRDRISIERGVYFGSSIAEKRADIFISDADQPDTAYIIVEVKKPKRKDGLEQLKSYCNAEGAPIAVWTNGGEEVILHREDPNNYRNLSAIPRASQTLAEVINERVSIEQLRASNKLITERWTLKKIILDLEDLVLANAGVDAFEEVFKLVYAKLFDEWKAERRPGHVVEFRAAGETHQQLYKKINDLLEEAKNKWPGVFATSDRIDLIPAHLAVCVSFLQDIALFNSNLQIIDEAFEYLVTQVAKGAKGQYFTPRHVIDMSVKMLNPKADEYMIDTAAGSCGFTVHTIFHVWGGEMTAQGPSRVQAEYASEMVYGLDFDNRSVKIAKALNLIAGDGKTNVYRVNTLDPRTWDDAAHVGLRHRLHRFPNDRIEDERNQTNFRYFDFDLIMTNPPFAGDIADTRILHQYEIARKANGRGWETKLGRDILFIERNLEFLKPGGRMAIVLPQGRFNNISDERFRRFIAEHCRILAVVGLNVNTFKPHTGTKTSVLFLQKWNDDPAAGILCPRADDYPIFFATSQSSGKDNSGEYLYKRGMDGQPLLDSHGHLVIDHDLDEIATAFVLFAQEQAFPFWEGIPAPF
ncbi:MAG: N-6 DNA methylase [Chloroflexota bacterium]